MFTKRFIYNNLTHAACGLVLGLFLPWYTILIVTVVYVVGFVSFPIVLKTYKFNKNYVIGCGINTLSMVTGGILGLIIF